MDDTDVEAETYDFASPWLRFGAYLLESFLQVVTLGIGWCIWALTTIGEGQTPAKRMLGLTVVDTKSMKPLGAGRMFWMRGVLAIIPASACALSVGILSLWPFWDRHNQNLMDKFSSAYVVRNLSPS